MDAKLVSKTTIAAAAVGGGGREKSGRETLLDEVSVENLSDLSSYLEKLKEFREVVLGRIREAIDNEDDMEEEEEEEVEE